MRDLRILCLFLNVMLFSTMCYAQDSVTLLERNYNNRAQDLIQELNKTRDTLKLKSEINILRVSFFSHTDKKKLIVDLDFKEVNIPLHHLDTGRFTITVHREDKIIVLSINRLKTILKPKHVVANLEESIVEASLSMQEQDARKVKASKTRVKKDNNLNKKAKRKTNTRVVLTPKKTSKKKAVNQNLKKINNNAIAMNTDKTLVIKSENGFIKKSKINKEKPMRLVNNSSVDKNVTYNITLLRGNDKTIEKQSREEYRKTHLRPNGKKYN